MFFCLGIISRKVSEKEEQKRATFKCLTGGSACVCACMRACVCVNVCACEHVGGGVCAYYGGQR